MTARSTSPSISPLPEARLYHCNEGPQDAVVNGTRWRIWLARDPERPRDIAWTGIIAGCFKLKGGAGPTHKLKNHSCVAEQFMLKDFAIEIAKLK